MQIAENSTYLEEPISNADLPNKCKKAGSSCSVTHFAVVVECVSLLIQMKLIKLQCSETHNAK